VEQLCWDHGWSPESVEKFLCTQGLEAIDAEASQDPAENPMQQRRLELLLEILTTEGWDKPTGGWVDQLAAEDGLHPAIRQTSARESTASIRFWAPHAIADDWHGAIQETRKRLTSGDESQEVSGDESQESSEARRKLQKSLPVWAAATILLKAAVEEWEKTDPKRRPVRSKLIDRDGCRCLVPDCRCRRNLEGHHGKYRSAGGPDTPDNLVTMCAGHHRGVIHKGYGSVEGRAPQALRWELGKRPGRKPLLTLRGEKIISKDDLKDNAT
jgi:hypothetical protein